MGTTATGTTNVRRAGIGVTIAVIRRHQPKRTLGFGVRPSVYRVLFRYAPDHRDPGRIGDHGLPSLSRHAVQPVLDARRGRRNRVLQRHCRVINERLATPDAMTSAQKVRRDEDSRRRYFWKALRPRTMSPAEGPHQVGVPGGACAAWAGRRAIACVGVRELREPAHVETHCDHRARPCDSVPGSAPRASLASHPLAQGPLARK
jgi:hypothetical protein